MIETHPWMHALSPADRDACARDLAAAAGTDGLAAKRRAWQETAAAVADGRRRTEAEWLEHAETMERP